MDPSRKMRTTGHRLEVGRGRLKSRRQRQGPGPEDWVLKKRNGTCWRLEEPGKKRWWSLGLSRSQRLRWALEAEIEIEEPEDEPGAADVVVVAPEPVPVPVPAHGPALVGPELVAGRNCNWQRDG